jgi:hypothetical protein
MDRSGTGSRWAPLAARPEVLCTRPKMLRVRPKMLRVRPKMLRVRPKMLPLRPKVLRVRPKMLRVRPRAPRIRRQAPWAWRELHTRRGAPWAWRGTVLSAAVAVMSGVLAACGSVPASTTAASSGTTAKAPAAPSPSASQTATATEAVLCRDTASVSGLEIVRNYVSGAPELQIAFPERVGVATPAGARAVARALCALPLFPHGIVSCPVLLAATTYLLRFTANGRRLPVAGIEASGCEAVTGVGPTRQAASSPGFWRTLAAAANMRLPGRSVPTISSRPCRPITVWEPGCRLASGRADKINACPA